MTDDEKAAKMEELGDAMFVTIDRVLAGAGLQDHLEIVFSVLGSVAGCCAKASGEPTLRLRQMVAVAKGVVSGELLD